MSIELIVEQQDVTMPDDEDFTNDNGEFDIKVEAVENNAIKSNLAQFKVQETQTGDPNSTFNVCRNILQGITHENGELQQVNFQKGDGITQFHIQMPLSINDLQNLQKITHNVFMSQAALPEDSKVLHTHDDIVECDNDENILVEQSNGHDFLTSTPSSLDDNNGNKIDEPIVVEEDNLLVVTDNTKDYMPPDGSSFNADQHGNLFIKSEHTNTPGNIIQREEVVEGVVKCETEPAENNQLFSGISCDQIMYFQVDSNQPGGESHVFPITFSSVDQNITIASKPITTSVTSMPSNSITSSALAMNIGTDHMVSGSPTITDIIAAGTSASAVAAIAGVVMTTGDNDNDNTNVKVVRKNEREKRKRSVRSLAKVTPADKSNLRSLAPRLLSVPLYAGAQAAVGIGKSLLKPVNLGALQIIEGGQYFEVLGRCTQCFRFSRTTTYCRAEKNHREPKSSVCMECEALGVSTVVCRRKLNHSAPNAQPLNIVINTALQKPEHVQQLCVKNNLPPCFCELHSIVLHHADITFVGQKRDNSAAEMKAEMKYDIQEFPNTNLLTTTQLSRNENEEYGNVHLSAGQVISDSQQICSEDILSGGLGGKDSIVIDADDNLLSATEMTGKGNLEYDVLITRKPDVMKSEIKYDGQEFSYNDFVTIPRVTRKPTDYARGYLYPYTKEKWTQWLTKFCYQTSTNFRVRTGKRVNKKLDHGLANHNGRIVPYRTLETQLYNCALGGKPRKRKTKDGCKKRKERGSKLIGCTAVIHTRLLETEYNWCALEITAPKISAHMPFHDPRENLDMLVEYGDVLLAQTNTGQFPNTEGGSATAEQKFDFVQKVGDENVDRKKGLSSLEVKRNTKNLLLTCASLTDMIDNSNFLLSIQEQSCDLLNRMHKEAINSKENATKKAKRTKYMSEEEEQETGDEVMTVDKEQIANTENIQQIEHIGIVNIIN